MSITDEKLAQSITYDRWKNRRRMAWVSVLAGVVYPVLLLFTDSNQL